MTDERLETPLPPGVEPLQVQGGDVHRQHDRLRRLIAARLDQACADLLAVPDGRGADGALAWRAPSGGQLVRPRDADRRQALQADADAKLARIAGLAEDLAAQGDAGLAAAAALRAAITIPPDVDPLYEADGAAILALWGTGTAEQAAAHAPPTMPEPPPPAAEPGRRRPATMWAAPAVLALLAGWLGFQLSKPLPAMEVVVPQAAQAAPDPTVGIQERIAALDGALAEAAGASGRFQAACGADDAGVCPAGAIAARPWEVMLVLDATGSMEYPVDTPEALETQVMRAFRNGDGPGWRRAEAAIKRRGGESRMSVARQAILSAVDDAPAGVDFGLLTFHDCKTTMFRGRYQSADLEKLDRELGRIAPSSGTALAVAIQRAASLIEGGRTADDPVNMVLISDGYDGCGGDPCAAARAAKAALPGLVINVLDLAQVEKLSCVAAATGGRYARLGDAFDVAGLTEAATAAAGAGAGQRCLPAR